MPSNIRDAWRDPAWRAEFVASIAILVPVLFVLTHFLDAIEGRHGVELPDPVLALFPAVNLTWVTFLLIYAGVIAGLGVLTRHPRRLLLVLQGYAVMVVFRMAAMYLSPLEPPPGMIELRDPFVEFFGGGKTLTRDLFFSGHTSTMFLLFLVVPGKRLRIAYLCSTLLVGLFVVLQHVHYAFDVFAAPFFAFGAYTIVVGICKRRGILVN
ncbi:MAG TPA: phosphatase PAP2-related protein [Bacteroidota bacterium]|nr:phosphatase PAP2-related protein [Bacteroidota bacterium]